MPSGDVSGGGWGAISRTPVKPDGVARCRRCLGLTQSDFAEAVGVGRVTVARWETGVIRPTASFVGTMLDLLSSLASGGRGEKRGKEFRKRFAAVALFGSRVRLSPDAWCDLFDLPGNMLTDVPTVEGRDGRPLAAGHDVGIAFERRLRKRDGRARLTGDAARATGERRLIQEIIFLADGLRAEGGASDAGISRARGKAAV